MLSDNETVYFGGAIAFFECTIGALFHSMHIPFTGQWLSLLQIALLSLASRAKEGVDPSFAVKISSCAMVIKAALSPGKKLTPMVALFLQGTLFGIPFYLFGNTLISRAAGALLAALWGIFQPFISLWVVFGSNVFRAWGEALHFLGFAPATILFVIVTIKSIAALSIALVISCLSQDSILEISNNLKRVDIPHQCTDSDQKMASLWRRVVRRVSTWPIFATLVLVPLWFWVSRPDGFGEFTFVFLVRSLAGLLILEAIAWERLFFWARARFGV